MDEKEYTNDYAAGDVVLWTGFDTAFGVIRRRESEETFSLDVPDTNVDDYDSCHISYLQLATPKHRSMFFEKHPKYLKYSGISPGVLKIITD